MKLKDHLRSLTDEDVFSAIVRNAVEHGQMADPACTEVGRWCRDYPAFHRLVQNKEACLRSKVHPSMVECSSAMVSLFGALIRIAEHGTDS